MQLSLSFGGREWDLHWVIPLMLCVIWLSIVRCHNILYLAKNFESWVFFHLSSQIMLRWIRLLFQGILINYHHALRRHIWVLVHSSLLWADLRISTLICRILPRLGLINHPRSTGRLINSLLLMVTHLATWHLLNRCGLHDLVVWQNGLEVHHIMFHVCLRRLLIDNTWVQIRLFGHIGVCNTNISHIFGWTRLKSLDCTLQRFAPLLNSWFTIWFHQRR